MEKMDKKVNKGEFVEIIKKHGGYKDKKEAEVALSSFVAAVKEVLKENIAVELVGFGKFENVLQKGKKGKVPGRDATYETEDKWVPRFKAGKALKAEIEKIEVEVEKSKGKKK